MEEKEIKKYNAYKKVLTKKKVNWFDRIRFWKMLKKELELNKKEIIKKQDMIYILKNELSATQISLNVAYERIMQLEQDLKEKEKKTRKVKKQTK